MKIITETRKEDDLYYKGGFWIIADTYPDILMGNFRLIGEKIPVSFYGELQRNNPNKKNETHQALWASKYRQYYPNKSYDYFPRGRVEVYNGVAYVNINSRCNTPNVVDTIIREYNLGNLELNLSCNDIRQGSHYDFQLK